MGAVKAVFSKHNKNIMPSSHRGWSIQPTFWITWLWPNKVYINDVFKGTHSEKKNSHDDFATLAFFNNFLDFVFSSNGPLKK